MSRFTLPCSLFYLVCHTGIDGFGRGDYSLYVSIEVCRVGDGRERKEEGAAFARNPCALDPGLPT